MEETEKKSHQPGTLAIRVALAFTGTLAIPRALTFPGILAIHGTLTIPGTPAISGTFDYSWDTGSSWERWLFVDLHRGGSPPRSFPTRLCSTGHCGPLRG